MSDAWADTEKRFAGDSWEESGTNLYGCFKQFYLLKKANRHLKVLLSIGGSSYSTNFSAPASTDSGRSRFASTAVSLVANLGLDGLDIDWEFPQDDTEAADMVLLLQSIRAALDAYENSLSTPYHFQLTVACPTGPSNYQTLHLADMDQYVDFWFLMAYNYAGSWSSVTGNQANLFPSLSDPASTPFNTAEVIGYYIAKGIAPNKIVLGMPIYGQSFAATDGLGKPFNGVGSGTWETGLYDFKALPLSGATEFYDRMTGSSYSYDSTSKELISYDNVAVAKQKAAFIQQMDLGGAVWWESSADKVGSESLIQNVAEILGGYYDSGLESSQNQLAYPNSTYENLRAGMPGSGSVPTTTLTTVSISESASSISLSTSNLDTASLSSAAPLSSTPKSGFLPSGLSAYSQFTTSTIYTTSVSTIISYASTVENCPSYSTILTTLTILLSTTICPVAETSAESGQPSFVSISSTYSQTSLTTQRITLSSTEIPSSIPPDTKSTEVITTAISDQTPQSSTTSTRIVPGENGVPGCAYVLADDLGAGAMCSLDYCYCDGTIAPLLTSTLSGTVTTNCDYPTQPTINSCPQPPTSSTITTIIATIKPTTISSVVIVSCSSSNGVLITCIPFTTSRI